jgi:hypothetical protein
MLAAAEPQSSTESDLHLAVTAVAGVRFDDNVLLAPHDKESDTIFVLMPGLELNYSGGDTTAGLVAREQFLRYSDHDSLNASLPSVFGNCAYEGPQSKLALKASYQEFDQNSLAIRSADQRVKHNLTNASLDGLWNMTAKTRIGAGVAYDHNVYPSDLTFPTYDSENLSFPLDVYYEVTQKLDLSLGYRYRRATIEGGATDSNDNFFSVGAKGDFTPKLGGQVRIGLNQRNFTKGGSEDQLGTLVSLTYIYSPKATFETSISNDFNSSALGSSVKVFSIREAGRFEIAPEWNAEVGVSYESTEYGVSPNAALVGRKDNFTVGDVTVTYAISKRFSVQGAYLYRTNSSTDAGVEFNSNVLSLSAAFRY